MDAGFSEPVRRKHPKNTSPYAQPDLINFVAVQFGKLCGKDRSAHKHRRAFDKFGIVPGAECAARDIRFRRHMRLFFPVILCLVLINAALQKQKTQFQIERSPLFISAREITDHLYIHRNIANARQVQPHPQKFSPTHPMIVFRLKGEGILPKRKILFYFGIFIHSYFHSFLRQFSNSKRLPTMSPMIAPHIKIFPLTYHSLMRSPAALRSSSPKSIPTSFSAVEGKSYSDFFSRLISSSKSTI